MMREHYAVHEITETARIGHMDVLSGDDAFQKALETLPGGEPAPGDRAGRARAPEQEQPHFEALDGPVLARLASYAGNRAVSRAARPSARAGHHRPSGLQDAGDGQGQGPLGQDRPAPEVPQGRVHGHPVDWKAEVLVDGKSAGSGDGSLEIDLVKDSKHDIRVVPKPASKDLDYYEARTVTLKKAAAGDFDVRLRLQPREPVLHRRELGRGRHRPGEGRQGHDSSTCSARR